MHHFYVWVGGSQPAGANQVPNKMPAEMIVGGGVLVSGSITP